MNFHIYSIEDIVFEDLLSSNTSGSDGASSVDTGGLRLPVFWRKSKVPLSTDKLVFIDSIISPKLIIVSSISYDPSTLNDQLKLDTFPNIPS